jgi:hypothetical protein
MKEEKLSLPDINEIEEAVSSQKTVLLRFLSRGKDAGEEVAVTVIPGSVEKCVRGRVDNPRTDIEVHKARVKDSKGRTYLIIIPVQRNPESNPFLKYGWAKIIAITPAIHLASKPWVVSESDSKEIVEQGV